MNLVISGRTPPHGRSITRSAPACALLLGSLAAATPLGAQSFAGTGPSATPPFVLTAGMAHLTIAADEGPFEAFLIGSDGSVVARLEPSRHDLRIPRSGRYLFDVRTGGSWSIHIEESDPLENLATLGQIEGEEAAGRAPRAGWLARGFGAGLLLGPIGTLLVTRRADDSGRWEDAELEPHLAGREPAYDEAFREAYLDQRRNDRRTAALVGGLTGTAVLAFVILQATVWGDEPSSTGNPPGNGTTTTRVPIISIGIAH